MDSNPGYTTTPATRPSNYPNNYPGGTDAGELVEKLLSNDHVADLLTNQIFPEHVRSMFAVLFGRTTKLTFINDEQFRVLWLMWLDTKYIALQSVPKGDYQVAAEGILKIAGMEFYMNLCRSKGHRLNERELLSASTSATFSERPIGGNQSENVPFFNRLINAVKGGKQ